MLTAFSTVKFKSDVLLGNFCPDNSTKNAHIVVPRDGYQLSIFLSEFDSKTFSRKSLEHRPKAISSGHFVTRKLSIQYRFNRLDKQQLSSFTKGEWGQCSPLLGYFADIVKQEKNLVYTILCDFLKQGDVAVKSSATDNYDFLTENNFRYCHQNCLVALTPRSITRQLNQIKPMTPINLDGWSGDFKTLLLEQASAPVWHVLFAKASSSAEEDVRAAMFHLVSALETAVASICPAITSHFKIFGSRDEGWIRNQILSNSVAQNIKIFLSLIESQLKGSNLHIDSLLQIVKKRNALIHTPNEQDNGVDRKYVLESLNLVANAIDEIEQLYYSTSEHLPVKPISLKASTPRIIEMMVETTSKTNS